MNDLKSYILYLILIAFRKTADLFNKSPACNDYINETLVQYHQKSSIDRHCKTPIPILKKDTSTNYNGLKNIRRPSLKT